MLPLYAARIEDLGPGDFVKVDCVACHHVALLTQELRNSASGWFIFTTPLYVSSARKETIGRPVAGSAAMGNGSLMQLFWRVLADPRQ
jgi:hypothetical protein